MTNLAVPGAGYTWAVNGTPTAAQLNQLVRDYITFLANPPLLVAGALASTSMANLAWTALSLTTPGVDTYGGWASANPTRYTCQAAGYYHVDGIVAFTSNTTGFRGAGIRVNGVAPGDTATFVPPATGNPTAVPIACDVFLNAGDYLELVGFQNSGAALTTAAGNSRLTTRWVHA